MQYILHIVIELAFIEITLFRAEYIPYLLWLLAVLAMLYTELSLEGGAGAPEFGVSKKRTALWEENRGTTNYLSMDGDFFLGILSFFSW